MARLICKHLPLMLAEIGLICARRCASVAKSAAPLPITGRSRRRCMTVSQGLNKRALDLCGFRKKHWSPDMCNLYSQTTTHEAVTRLFKVSGNRAAAFDPMPAVFPGHEAPVVRRAEDGEREISLLSWGFVLPQPGRAAKRVTNARDEKVRTSSFWKGSFVERRCLVPGTSFAEPMGSRPAVWHWFGLKGETPRPLFAFAGLWRHWKGPLKAGGDLVEMDVYAILTTTSNTVVQPIHPTRMPVMLSGEEQFNAWLNGSPDEAYALARPFPADSMRIVHKGENRDTG